MVPAGHCYHSPDMRTGTGVARGNIGGKSSGIGKRVAVKMDRTMRQSPSEMPKRQEPIPHPGDQIENPISWEPSLAFLKYAITSLLAGALAFLIAVRIFEPQELLRAFGSVLVALVAVTGWYLLSRSRIQATINVLAYGSWVIATAMSAFTGGVRAPIVIAYPLIILMIGWMNRSRAALVAAGLTVTTTVGFVLAESWGFLPPPPVHSASPVRSCSSHHRHPVSSPDRRSRALLPKPP